jgi:hypothetical protein
LATCSHLDQIRERLASAVGERHVGAGGPHGEVEERLGQLRCPCLDRVPVVGDADQRASLRERDALDGGELAGFGVHDHHPFLLAGLAEVQRQQ